MKRMVNHRQYVLAICVLLAAIGESALLQNYYQIPVTRQRLGYIHGYGIAAAPVQIDAYVCLQSPQDGLPLGVILDVTNEYGPRLVRLSLHAFPLPYVRSAYLATRATRAVNNLVPEVTIAYMQKLLSEETIDELSSNITEDGAVDVLTDLAVELSSNITRDSFMEKYEDTVTDHLCRYEWQSTIIRGVYQTPWFLINDMPILDFRPDWTRRNWTYIIDPLLENYEDPGAAPFPTCLPGEPGCIIEPPPCVDTSAACNVIYDWMMVLAVAIFAVHQ